MGQSSPPSSYTPSSPQGAYSPQPVIRDAAAHPVVPASYPVSAPSAVDPAVAFWSAIALALLFPVVAVPVGLVFLMLDDRRKAELGRITLIWGIVFSILQLFVSWLMVQGTVMAVVPLLKAVTGRSQPANLSDSVPSLQMPGIPNSIATPGPNSPFSPPNPVGFPTR